MVRKDKREYRKELPTPSEERGSLHSDKGRRETYYQGN